MITVDTFGKIVDLAYLAHKDQKRRDGSTYMSHLRRVMDGALRMNLRFLHWKIDPLFLASVAVSHDLLEDQPAHYPALREISAEVADAVAVLSRKNESYYSFISRILLADKAVRLVKLADLADNMSDLDEGSMKDKYRFAYATILKSLGLENHEDFKDWMLTFGRFTGKV